MRYRESPHRYGDGRGRRGSPARSGEKGSPEPERPETPAEEAGAAPHQLDEPPQAEGERDQDEGASSRGNGR